MFLVGIAMVCHEWKIEEQYKKKKKTKMTFLLKILEKNAESLQKNGSKYILSQFKRLGVVGDFENYYSTMSNDAEAQIVRELGKVSFKWKFVSGIQTGFMVDRRKNCIS